MTLIWPDLGIAPPGQRAVLNAWLQLTVKPGRRTGLDRPHTFYYGNLVGDDDRPGAGIVDRGDVRRVLGRLAARVSSGSSDVAVDFNRNGRVDVWDYLAARRKTGRGLARFIAPLADAHAIPGPVHAGRAAASTVPLSAQPPRRRGYTPVATAVLGA